MKKYLGELLKDREYGANTLIIAPTGAGKTHYIINELSKEKRMLYVCDNTSLKESVLLEDNTNDSKEGFGNIAVICYKELGKKLRFNNDEIKKYDVVVCDEIHNLVDYQGYNDDADLSHCIKELFKSYEKTQVFYFTATPYYVDELFKKTSIDIDKLVERIDFTKSKEIKRYMSLVTDYFSSYQQIPTILDNNKDNFEFNSKKALIYTNQIYTMKNLEEMIASDIFRPISIWSITNEENRMSEEQLKVREHLLKTGELLEPYNVLLINKATETGVNITDKEMVYCIINTTNKTEQIQARGRLRHDIIELKLKADKTLIQKDLYSIDEFLDRPLTKEDKDALCEKLNLFDAKGRLLKWTSIKNLLIKQGFEVVYDNKAKKIAGKVIKISEITKK